MQFTAISILSFAAAMATATVIPKERGLDLSPANTTAQCIEPKLCCKELTTPVDGLVDGLLGVLGINGKEVVGEVGLLCHAWTDKCEGPPSCCTEANVLDGVLALGCEKLSN